MQEDTHKIYDRVDKFYEGRASVCLNGKWGGYRP
jgi:hypothetical protein